MASTTGRPKIILASRSPRRRQLLVEAGYPLEVVFPHEAVENEPSIAETPAQLVARLAFQKAADVAARVDSGLVVGCDTVVECDGRILGKPVGEDHARQMLRALRGRHHRVLSGLCVWRKPGHKAATRVAETLLFMDRLRDAQIDEYLASGAWEGKAGAFGYQDRLGWVHVIRGSESNVVGLPLELLAEMLA
jgi:septum formation protein